MASRKAASVGTSSRPAAMNWSNCWAGHYRVWILARFFWMECIAAVSASSSPWASRGTDENIVWGFGKERPRAEPSANRCCRTWSIADWTPSNGDCSSSMGRKHCRAGIRKKFPGSEIQRCQIHKRRNVVEHLPETHQADIERRLKAAYAMSSYKDAKAALDHIADYLERLNPSAARSLKEGLEETLTLHRLGVADGLRVSFKSTNIIESSLARVEQISGRVKRWRAGDHLQRWTGKALLIAEESWRKVKGWQ